jgi:23S rRNA (cytosine1962-C5)-methyltransferase
VIQLRLHAGGRHRVLHGHPWVFSNQLVDAPRDLDPGEVVEVVEHGGRFVGLAHAHPNTLIAARILERRPGVALDDAWLRERLEGALALRRRVLRGRAAFRWLHGEADGLPGLIIDRYGDRAVATANSAGMERWRPRLTALLADGFGLEGLLWKCDGRGRSLEGLPDVVEAGFGAVEGPWSVDDDGLAVAFDPWGGQKTGLFLDMWENRRRMVPALGAGRVLDLFAYVGQWGLHAAAAGADDVCCVDRSAGACAQVEANAAANGLAVRAVASDVRPFLDSVADRSVDGVVCDPPSFIRSRKDVAAGTRAYRGLFTHALRVVRPGGVAVLASCSHHLQEDRFADVIAEAARRSRRRLRVLVRGDQAPCHPVPVDVPESRYLKCWLVEVGDA